MIIDIDEISKQWKLDEPQLDILGQQVVSLLKKGLFAVELHPEISYRTKEIQSIINIGVEINPDKDRTYSADIPFC